MLTEQSAAQVLGCSVGLLRKWRLRGQGPSFTMSGRLVQYSEEALAAFVRGTSAENQRHPLTQVGNAERLVSRHRDEIRYCHAWRKWLTWHGSQWKLDDRGQIYQLAKATVRSIYSEVAETTDEGQRANIAKHAQRSERQHEMESMIALARSEVAVTPGELDRDPWLFNCQNGTIDLRTGTLREHHQADLLSKMSPVAYDPSATCPTWMAVLSRLFTGDAGVPSFLQMAIGYTLTGVVTEKALFVFVGDGDNGKTTLLEAIRYVMGDYAGTVEINHLMQNASSTDQQRAIAELYGRRFVTASEAEEGQRLNEAKIKQITGMGRLTGRRVYGHPFEFEPRFKLFIDANHKPVIRGSDVAIWNRIRLVPFNISIPRAEQDRQLLTTLRAEAPGILAWAVRGCLDWQRQGCLTSPSEVSDAVASYRQEMDLTQEFVGDECVIDQTAVIPFTTLYSRYQKWCEQLREQPITLTAFGKWLTTHGFEAHRTSGARLRRGLQLKENREMMRSEGA